MPSPTSRSMALLRGAGYTPAVVERFNPHVGEHGIRQDLWGFLDLLAIRADKTGVLGIQATSASNMSARLRKIRETPAARTWVIAGNRLEVWGWLKAGRRWFVRKREIRIEDLRDPHPNVGRDGVDVRGGNQAAGTVPLGVETETVGWRATCSCNAGEPVPAIVCDHKCRKKGCDVREACCDLFAEVE